jgi:signal transduction histidine kinase
LKLVKNGFLQLRGGGAIALAVASIFLLLFIDSILISRMQERGEENVGNALQTVLETTHQALITWRSRVSAVTIVWADSPEIKNSSRKLLNYSKTSKDLKSSPIHLELRKSLQKVINVNDFKGYFIVSKEMINLSSLRDSNIGKKNLLAGVKLFWKDIWSGKTATSAPLKSDVELGTTTGGSSPTMFVGAPIFDSNGGVESAFIFRIDPLLDFTKILQRGRIGKSGETYAFNGKGFLVSESRFNDHLKKANLLEKGQKSTLAIKVSDPGVNLTLGSILYNKNEELPLTVMAHDSINGKGSSHKINKNLKGYRDYRGVPVVGAWIWDEHFSIGITTEIDKDEAFENLNSNKNIIFMLTILSCILIVLLTNVQHQSSKKLLVEKELIEKKYIEKHAQLVQSEKLASLGVLSAGMAHELNNPLTIIQGFSAHIDKTLGFNHPEIHKDISEYFIDINDSVKRMSNIINHMRDFSRQTDLEFSPVNINEIVEKSFILLDAQMRLSGIEVTKELASEDIVVSGDGIRLEQVFVNLIINARDAIKSSENTNSGILKVSTEVVGRYAVIKFSDNGCGLDDESTNKIFDPFFTTKDVGEGTGLGLSISHGIVVEHNGEISCSSSDESGSTFTIKLALFVDDDLPNSNEMGAS